ncbi:MAG: CocE/NonD family hydrolase [Gemmatimonadales bacterium]
MRRSLAALSVVVTAGSASAQDVHERNVPVPMRDGVVLRADVLRPAGPGPFPVLVYRTPYGKDRAVERYSMFRRAVARGYAVVAQDVRGRYASDGRFDPYRQEGRDGYDTIEWAASQPWSNGDVGSFGLSYPGAVQWLAAVERPPHLRAMVPAMTYATPENFFTSGGVYDLSWPAWIWLNISSDVRTRGGLPGPATGALAAAVWDTLGPRLAARLPITDVPELAAIAPWYLEWLAHPPGDPWWRWATLTGKYDRVDAAVLGLSGWHDEAYGPDGALRNFSGLQGARRNGSTPRHRVLVGPWVHGIAGINDSTAGAKSGDRAFGGSGGLDYDELILRWMDRWVRRLPNGADADPAVRVYVMGEGRWLSADTWPLPGTRAESWFLSAGASGRGGLTPSAPKESATTPFISDPAEPVTDPHVGRAGAHDYRALAERQDVAVFESAPLDQPLRVVGEITAEIHISVDAPDADLWVHLQDVAPDGTAWNLMSPGLNVARASWRNGGPERRLLEPGTVYRLRFGNLLTGNSFAAGHRIRVVLSGAFMPHFSRNLQTGTLETESTATRRATITIHHGPEHPSRLELPIIP